MERMELTVVIERRTALAVGYSRWGRFEYALDDEELRELSTGLLLWLDESGYLDDKPLRLDLDKAPNGMNLWPFISAALSRSYGDWMEQQKLQREQRQLARENWLRDHADGELKKMADHGLLADSALTDAITNWVFRGFGYDGCADSDFEDHCCRNCYAEADVDYCEADTVPPSLWSQYQTMTKCAKELPGQVATKPKMRYSYCECGSDEAPSTSYLLLKVVVDYEGMGFERNYVVGRVR
jgi:hypothetical protein